MNVIETPQNNSVNTKNSAPATEDTKRVGGKTLNAANLEFWSNHPELFEEAVELNAPVNSRSEFYQQGFVFYDGHILAPTKEYSSYLQRKASGDNSAIPPRGRLRESLEDKRRRLAKEYARSVSSRKNPEDFQKRLSEDANTSQRERKRIARRAVVESIASGTFFDGGSKNAQNVEEFLETADFNTDQDQIFIAAIKGHTALNPESSNEKSREVKNEYTQKELAKKEFNQKQYAALFHIKEGLKKRLNDKNYQDDFNIESHNGQIYTISFGDAKLSGEIKDTAIDILEKDAARIIRDSILPSKRFKKIIEENKSRIVQNQKEALADKILEGRKIDYDGLLSKDSMDAIDRQQVVNAIVQDLKGKCLLSKENADGYVSSLHYVAGQTFAKALNESDKLKNLCEEKVDYAELIRNGLLECIRAGVTTISYTKSWVYMGDTYTCEKEKIHYTVEQFDDESFKKNQEKIGIDFKDPELFDPAFNGFINVIKTPNGEYESSADWYYDNIFANDPVKFLSMLKAFRQSEDCGRGLKAKLTRFVDTCKGLQEFLLAGVPAKEEKEKKSKRNILMSATRSEIEEVLADRQRELIKEARERGAEVIHTFDEKTPIERTSNENTPIERTPNKNTPGTESDPDYEAYIINHDFGIAKIKNLLKYQRFIELNMPDSNPQLFMDAFTDVAVDDINGENKLKFFKANATTSYVGFTFNYEGKQCMVAESFGDPAAMYLAFSNEGGVDCKKIFDLSKTEADKLDNVAVVDHIDKNHFDDDLDTSYEKAFMFFRYSDKDAVLFGTLDTQKEWRQLQAEEFSAWPLNVENEQFNKKDLDAYHEWQAKQQKEEQALKAKQAK